MRSAFDLQLVNGPTGDPALFADVIGAGRAVLIDLGNLSSLSARKLLRVSDVLLSHAHLDHFADFERLLRVVLGRERVIRLTGPKGTLARVAARLASYEWNLAESFREAVTFEVLEVHEDGTRRRARLALKERFAPQEVEEFVATSDVVRAEPRLVIRAAVLDHGVPCLAFALEEPVHVQVFRNALEAMGLGTGPWLRRAKELLLEGAPDDTPLTAQWRDGTRILERTVFLGALREQALRLIPGQRVVYVTDCAWTKRNVEKILELAQDADTLVIEAAFSHADRAQARARRHLTAVEAGTIARLAGVRRMIPFHFSPRYEGRFEVLEAEARAAFEGTNGSLALPEPL